MNSRYVYHTFENHHETTPELELKIPTRSVLFLGLAMGRLWKPQKKVFLSGPTT